MKSALIGSGLATLAAAHTLGKRGTVPVDGSIITSCVEKGVVALTFDDGPWQYTQEIVDQLTAAQHRATFFQNGQNWGNIYDFSSVLTSMIAGGHQIASHTWSHADLATLDAPGITKEMTDLEVAHLAIIGKIPTYMRPPYLSTNQLALDTLKGLGYKIIEVDIDTQDWAEGPAGEIDLSIQWYEGNQTAGGSISLNHDPYQPTAEQFIPAIITYLAQQNLKSVPVGECLGDDPANWYRGGSQASASESGSASSTSAGPTATGSGSASITSGPTASGNGTWTSSPTGTKGGNSGGPGPSKSWSIPSGLPTTCTWSRGHGEWPSGMPKPTWTPSPPSWNGPHGHGGDTEPGHGPDAGKGSLPGHKGQGNDGCNGTTSGSSGWVAAPTGTWGAGSNTPSWGQSHNGTSAQPTYYSNNGNTVVSSALVMGIAALAFFL